MIDGRRVAPARPPADGDEEAAGAARRPARSDWRRFGPDAAGLTVVVAVLVFVHAPVLFFGRTYSTDSYFLGSNGTQPYPGQVTTGYDAQRVDLAASIYAFEPWSHVVSEAYHDGHLPLWTPYQGAGAPLAANGQSSAFDPTMALVFAEPSQRSWDLTIFFSFVVSGCVMYALIRVLGCRPAGAVAAAVGFELSGEFFLHSNNSFNRAYMYLPVLFLAVEWLLRSRRILALAAVAAATAGCLLVGMPEAAFVVISAAALYAAVRIWLEPMKPSRALAAAWVGGGLAAGALLAAPLLLPFVQYESVALTGHDAGSGLGGHHDPFTAALSWVAPFFNGHDVYQAWAGGLTNLQNWVGGAVVALALVSLASAQPKRVKASVAFLVPAGLMLAKVYGAPVVSLIGRLPFAERVKFPEFGTPVAAFGLAAAAGFGVDAIARRAVDRRRLALIGAVAGLGVLVWAITSTSTLRAIGASRYLPSILGAAVAVAVVVAVAVWARRPWMAWLAVAAVAVELVVLFPRDNLAVRADPYVPPAWLQAAAGDMAAHPHDRVFAFDGLLMPNISSAFGLADIRTLDALYPTRYFRYIQTFVEPQIRTRFEGTSATVADETTPINYGGNPMFDLLGVRYLFSRAPRQAPGLSELAAIDSVHVYVNTAAMPRAFVVHDTIAVPDQDAAVAALSAGGGHFDDGAAKATQFDPRASAVVEAAPGAVPTDRCDGSGDGVQVERYDPGAITLRVTAACRGLVVLTDNYFPGWVATVDGRGAPIVATDLSFRGVPVPAGTSTVEFRYRPASFRIGVWLAGAVVAGFAFAGLFQWWWRARRRRPAFDSSTAEAEIS